MTQHGSVEREGKSCSARGMADIQSRQVKMNSAEISREIETRAVPAALHAFVNSKTMTRTKKRICSVSQRLLNEPRTSDSVQEWMLRIVSRSWGWWDSSVDTYKRSICKAPICCRHAETRAKQSTTNRALQYRQRKQRLLWAESMSDYRSRYISRNTSGIIQSKVRSFYCFTEY